MPQLVVDKALLQCSFGLVPSPLAVLPLGRTFAAETQGGGAIATIMDSKPLVNIKPFGMCTSLANPVVAAATTAALGVLTPMPCLPATAGPWAPGAATVKIGEIPAVTNTCKCLCSYGGVIQVLLPMNFTVSGT